MDRPTTEQREIVKSINVPSFVTTPRNEVELDAETMAILNNIPGNVQIEEQNHLNELEKVAQNYREEEWKRLLYYAPHKLMTDEIERRMAASEEFRNAMKSADEVMTRLKL